MSDTMQGQNSNRNPKHYDLPELPPDRNLRHDGMTTPGNAQPNKQGGEYQVGPGQTHKPASVTQGPIDPHSFAGAGGFNATL
ncbi:MAG: hypothetical protein KBD29_00025 [Candidatus Magasanikbacteria bacterium]|nr:hypothetical protein [Candidatus Magasanikbacteria bacterium]